MSWVRLDDGATMPKVYRAMKKSVDEKPVVEPTANGLGVRFDAATGAGDVDVDTSGNVILNGKGMSVAPASRDLPAHRVPKRLVDKYAGARGRNDTHCFTTGAGPFVSGRFAAGLDFVADSPTHGTIVPEALVNLDRFQADLANTRHVWTIDED
jgi:hypothetical protein